MYFNFEIYAIYAILSLLQYATVTLHLSLIYFSLCSIFAQNHFRRTPFFFQTLFLWLQYFWHMLKAISHLNAFAVRLKSTAEMQCGPE